MALVDELQHLCEEGLARIAAAKDLGSLDAVRVGYLGKKGSLTSVLRGLGTLPAQDRPVAGKVSNDGSSEL